MKKVLKNISNISLIVLFVISFSFNAIFAQATELDINITSKSCYLTDFNSGTVIFAKNENERLQIASMTKIMLLNLIFESLANNDFSLEDNIVVSANASGMGGSQVFLQANKEYKASALIKSIIIASANDASVAMSEFLFGSEELAVQAMNQKAEDWNLTNTLFSNCTGLPKPTQYSSAKDVAVMLSHLINHEVYFTFSTIWLDKIEHSDNTFTEITNTNKLVRFYEGCDGGKTGFTSQSGFCLSATAKRGNMRLIGVVINNPNSKSRFNDISSLFNMAFAQYINKTAVDKETPLDTKITIEKGLEDKLEVIPKDSIFIFSKKNATENIKIEFIANSKVVAPIKKGDKVGEIVVYKDNVEYAKTEAIANQDISQKVYFDYIKEIIKNWNL